MKTQLQELKNAPVWQLTGEELLLLLGNGKKTETPNETLPSPAKRYVYGLDGLRNLLQCSRTTASTIKSSGILNGCYSQVGRKLVFDAEAVLTKLQK